MRLFAICAILLALACSTPAQQTTGAAGPQAGSDVAARIGDRTITLSELDDRWRAEQPADHAQAVQKMYDGRKDALDAIVAEMLIEQAAAAGGVTPTKFTDDEVARRVTSVTDGQVAAFFQENQSQMQGRGFDAMASTIRRYLEEQQRSVAYAALIDELRKAGPQIRLALEPPRYDVSVGPDDAVLGNAKAAVTLVEFSDFQCPFCARVMPTLKRLHEAYGDRVRIVWKDFPLTSIHPQAFKAAEAGQCAREQGKFWEYHDRLFGNQQALEPEFLKKYAAEAGLDAAAFSACVDTAKYADRVQEQMGIGARLGVSSTPTVYVNGRLVNGAQPYEVFAAIIEEELARDAK
jgi:protein-disulfide isomerase